MVRVIAPTIGTLMPGENTRTGETSDPEPSAPGVIEWKYAAATIAGASMPMDGVASTFDDSLNPAVVAA